MSTIKKVKISIDILMTVLLLFLMGYQFWGQVAHEWAGAAMFLLFILHHILNRSWCKNLFKGKYSLLRTLYLIVNLALFAVMVGMMISGILLSRHVFAALPIQGGASLGRLVHMVCAYWGFALMALHLGLHWNMILKRVRIKKHTLVFLCSTAVAAYGLSVFLRRRLIEYMLMRTEFVFLDFGESKLYFYAEYLAMMGLFIYVAHYGAVLLKKKGKHTHIDSNTDRSHGAQRSSNNPA